MHNQKLLVGIFVALVLVTCAVGTITAAEDYKTTVATSAALTGACILDIDRDGDNDIAGATAIGYSFWWENVDGDGQSWTRHYETNFTIEAYDLSNYFEAHDMNGDGWLDVVCINTEPSPHNISWFEITNNGHTWVEHVIRSYNTISSIGISDIDGDDSLDIVLYNTIGILEEFVWSENLNGDGLTWHGDYDTGDGGGDWCYYVGNGNVGDPIYSVYPPQSIACGDVTGDNRTDIITVVLLDAAYSQLQVYRQQASGLFDPIPWYIIDNFIVSYESHCYVGDIVPGNGREEIILHAEKEGDIYIYSHNGTDWVKYLLIGSNYADDEYGAYENNPIILVDYNNDGDIDIITISIPYQEISWWENTCTDGNVSFDRIIIEDDFDWGSGLAVGDLTGSGNIDILAFALRDGYYAEEVAYWSLLSGNLNITGTAYNVVNGSTVADVGITWQQTFGETDVNQTDTTTALGNYSVGGLSVGTKANLTANKTGYEEYHYYNFLPYYAGTHTVNAYMLPSNISYNGSAIYGIVTGEPDALDNATVYIGSGTGYIINKTFNSSAYNSLVPLNHSNIISGTVVVTNISDEIPYTSDNYTMDYTNGTIQILSTGNMTNYTDYHIDYNYIVSVVNTTTNPYGFYIFENLTAGTYNIYASYPGYHDSPLTEVVLTEGGYVINNIEMSIMAGLTVIAKDAEELTPISAFTATLDGTTLNTTIGSIIFTDLSVDLYELSVSAVGYYVSEKQIYVDENMNTTVYLERRVEPGGPGVYYPPRLVEFRVQDIYGNPFSDVYVTAVGIQTTMGSWEWLKTMFGLDTEAAGAIQNTTMNGTTDSTGSLTFLMVETIKYEITFTSDDFADKTLTIYPKEERYIVIVGRTGFFDVEPQLFGEQIKWNFTMEKNDTHAFLNFTYNDTLGETTSGSYYIYTVNKTTGIEKLNLSNFTYCCMSTPESIDSNVWNHSCAIHKDDYRGKTYIMGFNATHDIAGEFGESVSVFFRYNCPLIEFAGWEYDPGRDLYQFISIALLIFLGMLFTGTTNKIGCVILPLAAWSLYGIGWFLPTQNLETSIILLGIATAVGIGIYVTTTGREKNLAS